MLPNKYIKHQKRLFFDIEIIHTSEFKKKYEGSKITTYYDLFHDCYQ